MRTILLPVMFFTCFILPNRLSGQGIIPQTTQDETAQVNPDSVVLEGTVAVNVFIEEIAKKRHIKTRNLMITELYKVLNDEDYDIKNFVNQILAVKRYKNSILEPFFS